jgi:hypothetical protein
VRPAASNTTSSPAAPPPCPFLSFVFLWKTPEISVPQPAMALSPPERKIHGRNHDQPDEKASPRRRSPPPHISPGVSPGYEWSRPPERNGLRRIRRRRRARCRSRASVGSWLARRCSTILAAVTPAVAPRSSARWQAHFADAVPARYRARLPRRRTMPCVISARTDPRTPEFAGVAS